MTDGFPLFPQLDLDDMTSREVLPILEDYFLVMWNHCQGGSTTIPWDEIEQYPHNFYDETLCISNPVSASQCPSSQGYPSTRLVPYGTPAYPPIYFLFEEGG